MKNKTKICKYCKTEVPSGAKICPNCKKKQGGKLKWIIIAIVAVALIGAFAGENGDDSTPKDTANISQTDAPKENDEQVAENINEEVNEEPVEKIEDSAIDNEQALSEYKKLKKIQAKYILNNTDDYKNKNVMSVAIVGDIDDNIVKLHSGENKDGLFYDFTLDCINESELTGLKDGDRICFAGKVKEKSDIGGCVEIVKCRIIASGENVSKYEVQLEKGKSKKEKEKEDKKNYINSCKTYSYTKIKRKPDSYDGKKIKVSGKVIQVQEGFFDSVIIRVEDSNGNDWWVEHTYSDKEDKILEDDNVTIYGECNGTEQYTTVLGSSRSIPSVEAKYIIIK